MADRSISIILVLAIVLTAVLTFTITKALCNPDPITTETVKTEIVTVRDTIRQVVYRDRVKAVIDTVKIEAGELVTYKASLDTTLVSDHYRIRTQVDYFHPDQVFSLSQSVAVAVDTVYVNRDRIVQSVIIQNKPNWGVSAIIGAVAFSGGFYLAHTLSR